VFPVDSQPNLAFTTTLHRLSAFTDTVNFVAENSQFAIGSGGNGRVLLLRYAVDWSRVRIAVAAALVLSIGVGVIVGLMTHRADLRGYCICWDCSPCWGVGWSRSLEIEGEFASVRER
jgi:uncharacterized oligopeptide transporter (OPT) family protein